MAKLNRARVREVADTAFVLLVMLLTLVLLLDRFLHIRQYVNMDYMLAIILVIGIFSILPSRDRRVKQEKGSGVV